VFGRAIGDKPHLITVLEKTEAQLQARLACADDGNITHVGSSSRR